MDRILTTLRFVMVYQSNVMFFLLKLSVLFILGFNYDGSQVPAEWFGWLHYKTDYLPSEDPARPKHKWMVDHTENLSGTPQEFMPYSTTRPKIEAWRPSMK